MMWKLLGNVVKGLKVIKKYGGLLIVLIDIVGYDAEKLEEWQKANKPDEGEVKVE